MSFQCIQISNTFSSRQGKVFALDELNFSVGKEEFVCIVGPSGCGKTTLLRIIAGLILPTTGKIVFGEIATNSQPQTAMVFQNQGLFPWMTVLKNVAFGLEMQGVSRTKRHSKAETFLKRVGLAGFLSNFPHELSGGMCQRVAILRAFIADPLILLMDEPFGSLDSQTRLVMQEELLRIWKENRKTVMYVTHDIDEAILLGDRILVMSGRPGSIRAEIPISLPRPRNMTDRNNPNWIKIHLKIWKMIEDEVRQDLGISP